MGGVCVKRTDREREMRDLVGTCKFVQSNALPLSYTPTCKFKENDRGWGSALA